MNTSEGKLFSLASLGVILFLCGALFPLNAEDFEPEQSRIKVNAVFIPQTVYELNRLKGRSAELQQWIGAKADRCIMEWAYSEDKNRLVPKNWIFLIENNRRVVGLIATDPETDDFAWRTTWNIHRHIECIRAIFSFQPGSIEGESISVLNLSSPSHYDFQKTKLVIIRGKHYWIVPKKGEAIENYLIAPIEALSAAGVFRDFIRNLKPTGMVAVGEDALSTFGIQSELKKIRFTPPDRLLKESEARASIQAANTDMVGEVPIYFQGATSNCWAYSLAMVHQWWSPINLGTGDTQVQAIRDYIGLGPDDGADPYISHQIMANWPSVDSRFEDFPITGYGVGKAFAVGEPTWDGTDPKTWLALEAPVVASIDADGGGPDSRTNHQIIITGYDDAVLTVYINNPWGFADSYNYSIFNTKYWGAVWHPNFPAEDDRRGMVGGLAGDNDYVSLSPHSISIPDTVMYDNEKIKVENIGLSVSGDTAGGGWDSFGAFNYVNRFNASLGWYLEPGHILIDYGVTAAPVGLGNWSTTTPVPPARTIEFSKPKLAPGESVGNASFYVAVDPSGRPNQIRINSSWTVWDHNDRTHFQAGRFEVFHDGVMTNGTMMMLTPMRIRKWTSGYTYIQVYDDDTAPPTIANISSQPASPVDGLYNGDVLLSASVSDSQSGINAVNFIYRYGSGSPVERGGAAGLPIGTWHCTIPKDEWTQNRGATIYWKVKAADADNDCSGDSAVGYSQEQALVLSPAVTRYTLTITAGEGGTTAPAPGTYSYDSGTVVEVEAKPESGYAFGQWTGDVPPGYETDNILTLTMDSAKSVMCHFSPVGQVHWSPTTRLTWTSGISYGPRVAVDPSGDLHLAWHDSKSGNSEIYYTKGADGGATWSANRRLTWTSGISECPAIATDPAGHIHVLWHDNMPGNYEVYYKRSTDGGATWSSNRRLSSTSGISKNPALAFDSSSDLHVVWQDSTPGNYEIFHIKSTDGGAAWSAVQRLTSTSGMSQIPAMAVDPSGNIYIVWQDDTPGNPELYFKRSTDGGVTWSPGQRLTWTSGSSEWPAIAVNSSGHIHVLWHDNTPGNYEIYYRKSTTGGASWSVIKRLTWTSGRSEGARIAVDSSDSLHVVWPDNTPGNYEIYYKKSTDGGGNWTVNQRLTWSSGNSLGTHIAVDPSDALHVVWHDNTPGNFEIYYKKGTR